MKSAVCLCRGSIVGGRIFGPAVTQGSSLILQVKCVEASLHPTERGRLPQQIHLAVGL